MEARFPFNDSDRVFGWTEDGTMTAAMELNRDGLHAHKAWFFFEDCIVCLGCGISMPSDSAEVVTTIEQNLLSGPVRHGRNWVSHRGITYAVLDGQPYELYTGAHEGDWNAMSPEYPKDKVSMNVFELTVRHGFHPADASYAYAVSPVGLRPRKAARLLRRRIEILSNTNELQSVRVDGRTLAVEWN